MRTVGPVGSLVALSVNDHVCWPYADRTALRAGVVEFLADGVSLGLRVAYAGPGTRAELRAHLSGLADVDALLARGGLEIIALDEIYGRGKPVDVPAMIGTYAAATERAVAEGYRGFRVSADATELVRTQEQHDAFVDYEFLVDRYASGHPFSAMCAYDTRLGQAVVAELASLHPAAPASLSPFHVYTRGDGSLGMSGEVDASSAPRFRRALERIRPDPHSVVLPWDLSAVTFIDHRALLAMDAMADRLGLPVVVRHAPPVVRRLAQLLALERVRIVDEEGVR